MEKFEPKIEHVNQAATQNSSSSGHYLVVLLNGEKYFVSLVLVSRIIKAKEIFTIPETFEFIEGVFNFSGEIVPVLNLKKLLKLPDIDYAQEQKFMICIIDGIKICFSIDDVEAEFNIDPGSIKTDTVKVLENDFISGEYIVKKEVVGIIDLPLVVDRYKYRE